MNLKVVIPLQQSNFSVQKPACQTNQPLTLLLFTSSLLNSCCWSFLELWSSLDFGLLHLNSDPSCQSQLFCFLYFSLPIHAYNQGASVHPHPSAFGLGHFGLSLNRLSSSLTLPFPKLPQCIDCKSDLGGSEAGAEVRIRNKQLYCNSCYMRCKSEYVINLISLMTCCFF